MNIINYYNLHQTIQVSHGSGSHKNNAAKIVDMYFNEARNEWRYLCLIVSKGKHYFEGWESDLMLKEIR